MHTPDDRVRQVETTKLRHGDDFYAENGRKKHRRGFSDPEVARAAARKGHEIRRLKKRKLQEYYDKPSDVSDEANPTV